MGKRAGGGAAGATASTSAGAGVEPATGRGGVPRSATAGLLGALHLVMTLVVAAARAEKEGGCQLAGISQAGLRGCHRALAEAAAGLRPGSRGYGSGPGGRPSAELRPAQSCSVEPHPEPGSWGPRISTCGAGRAELLLFSVILSPVFPLISCHYHFKTSRVLVYSCHLAHCVGGAYF